MIKLTGCIMIFSAAIIFLYRQCRTYKSKIALYEACAAALEDMSTAVRWQRQPLPDAIAAQQSRAHIGYIFSDIVQSQQPLQSAWYSCFSAMDHPLAEIICDISLKGDAEHILGQFDRATQRLRHFADALREAEQGRKKITCAAAMSTAMFLTILLL